MTFLSLVHIFTQRMASSFELCDEQLQVYKERAQILKASSYQNLFGAPVGRSRPRVRREVRAERDQPVRRYKPQSVNTLTGDIIGVHDQKSYRALSVPDTQYRGKLVCSAFYMRYKGYNHHFHCSSKIPWRKPQSALVSWSSCQLGLLTLG